MPNHISFNPADFDPVKKIALSFPGAEESVSHYDTPSVKINGKFMCRLVESGILFPSTSIVIYGNNTQRYFMFLTIIKTKNTSAGG